MRLQISNLKMMNCLFPLISLFFQGRIVGVLWAWPFHFLGMTRHGRLVHFKTTKKKDKFAPFWFEGYLELLSEPYVPKRYFYFGFIDGKKLKERMKNGRKPNITD